MTGSVGDKPVTLPVKPDPVTPPATDPVTDPTAPATNPVEHSFGSGQHFWGRAAVNGIDGFKEVAAWGLATLPAQAAGYAMFNKLSGPQGNGVFNFGPMAGQQLMRLTPALVSAIAGPAIADGAGYVFPNLIPKYKTTMSNEDKSWLRIERAGIAVAAVGLAAGLLWLKWPNLLKPGANMNVMSGVMGEAAALKAAASASGASIEAVNAFRSFIRPHGVFSNQLVIGAIGGAATLLLADRWRGAEGDDKVKWGAAAALTGVATIAGIVAAPMLTRGVTAVTHDASGVITGITENSSKLAILPERGLINFWKPNWQWFKDFGTKVAPYTVLPAGTEAYNNFDVVDAFNNVTDPRSSYNQRPTTTPPTTPRPTTPPATTPPTTPRPTNPTPPRP